MLDEPREIRLLQLAGWGSAGAAQLSTEFQGQMEVQLSPDDSGLLIVQCSSDVEVPRWVSSYKQQRRDPVTGKLEHYYMLLPGAVFYCHPSHVRFMT